ncbi:amidohydrolase family protein [Aeoliella mucimassa]|uniref:Aminodeoxyfutalosine deaminase n=1 Tax=Aeoliella mucimassa TaxID=2527972 RepID=A0A518AP27_9BACT|nr:amidohydrolase family protein [Aeoliella mucimassa]QDU56472.1 Aminodeoxyfutalosine deaminase [Aeoliella mucimassa]
MIRHSVMERTATAIRARIVFPVAAPPMFDGVVHIEGGKVVQVSAKPPAGVPITDLGDVALFPGMVNAHTHLDLSDRKHRIGRAGNKMSDWVRQVINERTTPKKKLVAVGNGAAQSIRHGVTTLADIATYDPLELSTNECGPRSVRFHEVIGFSQARAPSAHSGMVKKLKRSKAEGMPELEGVIMEGVAPHAPYTVSPPLLRNLVNTAAEWNVPVAFHLAESQEELDFLTTGAGGFQEILEERSMWDPWAVPRGSVPLDYLRILTRAHKALVIHGNYLERKELAFLARHRDSMSMVYCPRTHNYFQHAPYPLEVALQLGVRVALGTDSLASNPDLSILNEMRIAAARHPRVPTETILEMGTLAAAHAMGLGHLVGALSPGRYADMTAVPIPDGVPDAHQDILHAVLGDTTPPCQTWLSGETVDG